MDDQDPPAPAKSKLSPAERKARQADRLTTIRLRMAIWRVLDERGLSSPAEVGEALGLPAPAATALLARHQWRCCRPPRAGWGSKFRTPPEQLPAVW